VIKGPPKNPTSSVFLCVLCGSGFDFAFDFVFGFVFAFAFANY